MPYTNIVFVKFYIRKMLDEDRRFQFKLNDFEKFVFIMTIILSGKTNNKIPVDPAQFRTLGFLKASDEEISSALKKIVGLFPKLKHSKDKGDDVLYWENFDDLHNYVQGATKKTPKIQGDKEKKKYGEFVELADHELALLIKSNGEEEVNGMIVKMNNHIGAVGKVYASHYYGLKSWFSNNKDTDEKRTYKEL